MRLISAVRDYIAYPPSWLSRTVSAVTVTLSDVCFSGMAYFLMDRFLTMRDIDERARPCIDSATAIICFAIFYASRYGEMRNVVSGQLRRSDTVLNIQGMLADHPVHLDTRPARWRANAEALTLSVSYFSLGYVFVSAYLGSNKFTTYLLHNVFRMSMKRLTNYKPTIDGIVIFSLVAAFGRAYVNFRYNISRASAGAQYFWCNFALWCENYYTARPTAALAFTAAPFLIGSIMGYNFFGADHGLRIFPIIRSLSSAYIKLLSYFSLACSAVVNQGKVYKLFCYFEHSHRTRKLFPPLPRDPSVRKKYYFYMTLSILYDVCCFCGSNAAMMHLFKELGWDILAADGTERVTGEILVGIFNIWSVFAEQAWTNHQVYLNAGIINNDSPPASPDSGRPTETTALLGSDHDDGEAPEPSCCVTLSNIWNPPPPTMPTRQSALNPRRLLQ